MWRMTRYRDDDDMDMDLAHIPEPTAADLAALEDVLTDDDFNALVASDMLDIAVSLDQLRAQEDEDSRWCYGDGDDDLALSDDWEEF